MAELVCIMESRLFWSQVEIGKEVRLELPGYQRDTGSVR